MEFKTWYYILHLMHSAVETKIMFTFSTFIIFVLQEFSVRGMFLSAQFWPPFKDNTLKLPTIVTDHLDVYTKAFETYKV